MSVVKIEGDSLREALELAKDQLGEKAVVISRRKSKGRVLLAVSSEPPKSPVDLLGMRQEARTLFGRRKTPARAKTDGVQRCLKSRGASPALIETVCAAIEKNPNATGHPLDLAGAELARVFPVAHARIEKGTTAILAVVGGAGVGKTTTLAKLAMRFVQARRKVAMVTLDTYRVGAVEQVRALGKHVACPTHAARDILQLHSLLESHSRPDVILLDCTGRPDHDGVALRRLRKSLQERGDEARLMVYLAAEATMRPVAMEEELVRLGPLPLVGAIVTKTDETRRPAPVLEYLAKKKLGVAFLCNGRDLKQDFYRASGEAFANLMLKGRVN